MTMINADLSPQILEGALGNQADIKRLRNEGVTELSIDIALKVAGVAVMLAQQLVAEREKTRALTAVLREGGAL